ncbi:unnamed protein product [Lactuca virosa]|uniref:Uncharacterized protein n=1 Tax=Lactuca virosa TaxID=75947 RepID=A0AAU9LRI6_9ASTR|nr:unnamed protein product [Lactuca virosa]
MLGVRSRTSKILESELLQIPSPKLAGPISEFEPMDSGNEFELPPPFTDANTRPSAQRNAQPTGNPRIHS